MLCGRMSRGTADDMDVLEVRELNINDMKIDLKQTLMKLPINNREELYMLLRNIFQYSHIYYSEWKDIVIDTHVVHEVVNIIRRYESNELQLHGDGVRLLYQLSTVTSNKHAIIQVLSDASVIELLLRLLLEHPIYGICISILDQIVSADSTWFIRLNEICKCLLKYNAVIKINFE
jgi:hypothetical protein